MKKVYSYSHLNMLTGGGVLVTNLEKDLAAFEERNLKYTQAYVDALKQRIKDGLKLFAADERKEQKGATSLVKSVFATASNKAASLNADLKFNFMTTSQEQKNCKTYLAFKPISKKLRVAIRKAW